MRLISRMFFVAIMAFIAFALPRTAAADRVYYLVGVRHVYRIGTDKYFHAAERKQIEEDYADEVSADNAHYQYQVSHGANASNESAQLQSALHDLAVERDRRLAALYTQVDSIRQDHPAFNIKVDGPYQVIGVNYHHHDNIDVWDDYVAYAPWPGYAYEGPSPYGWSYGVVYQPTAFVSVYNGWYGGWIGFGSPAFVGFYGVGGPIVVAGLSVNVGLGFGVGGYFGGFYYNPGLGGFYHRGPGYFAHDVFRGAYIAGRGDPRAAIAARAGYTAGASAIRSARAAGYSAGIRAGARSNFSASGVRAGATARGSFAPSHAGYAHSATAARPGSAGAARPNRGSFARTGAPRANSGYVHNATRTSSARPAARSVTRSTGARASGIRGGGFGAHPSAARPSRSSAPSHSFAPSRSSAPARSFGGGNRGGGGNGKRRGG